MLETDLTYQRRDLEGAVTTYTGVTVFWSAVTGSPVGLGSGGKAQSDTRRAHVQASTLAVRPRQGDRIVSAAEGTWEVITDDVVTLSTRFVCHCRKVG